MPYLLDTNIVSELRRTRPDSRVTAWYTTVPDDALYLSVLVIGEIRQGIERLRRRDDGQARALDDWLATLASTYADRIAPVTIEIAEEWGRLNVPDPLPYVDGLMAATALVHGWTLATRNAKHVERTGVPLTNPFEFAGPR
jgi:predicted nucleic acid-binding protein